jgi:hypothetical protein
MKMPTDTHPTITTPYCTCCNSAAQPLTPPIAAGLCNATQQQTPALLLPAAGGIAANHIQAAGQSPAVVHVVAGAPLGGPKVHHLGPVQPALEAVPPHVAHLHKQAAGGAFLGPQPEVMGAKWGQAPEAEQHAAARACMRPNISNMQLAVIWSSAELSTIHWQ